MRTRRSPLPRPSSRAASPRTSSPPTHAPPPHEQPAAAAVAAAQHGAGRAAGDAAPGAETVSVFLLSAPLLLEAFWRSDVVIRRGVRRRWVDPDVAARAGECALDGTGRGHGRARPLRAGRSWEWCWSVGAARGSCQTKGENFGPDQISLPLPAFFLAILVASVRHHRVDNA